MVPNVSPPRQAGAAAGALRRTRDDDRDRSGYSPSCSQSMWSRSRRRSALRLSCAPSTQRPDRALNATRRMRKRPPRRALLCWWPQRDSNPRYRR